MDKALLDTIRALCNDARDGKRLTSTQTARALEILLAHIDALETVARAARELITEASQEWDGENEVYIHWWSVYGDEYYALKDALASVGTPTGEE